MKFTIDVSGKKGRRKRSTRRKRKAKKKSKKSVEAEIVATVLAMVPMMHKKHRPKYKRAIPSVNAPSVNDPPSAKRTREETEEERYTRQRTNFEAAVSEAEAEFRAAHPEFDDEL